MSQLKLPGAEQTGRRPRAAEFFAGIGLVRAGLERAGWAVVFANDIEPFKRDLYKANFGDSDFRLGDIREIRGTDVPDIELATASFPCTDLSLAGQRTGLAGAQSGMFWEFARILGEMDDRRPPLVMLENVPAFASSRGGEDLRAAVAELNQLGYSCEILAADARMFVPQSRERLFIIGAIDSVAPDRRGVAPADRPAWLERFLREHWDLDLFTQSVKQPASQVSRLADVIERPHVSSGLWWDDTRVGRFIDSLSAVQSARLTEMNAGMRLRWATAFRRTRNGKATWEIRGDELSGCLRATGGGSSKQALVEAGRGKVRIRWMTAREYARLQGAPDYLIPDAVSENQARFGFGDAVCVPVVEWIANEHIAPFIDVIGSESQEANTQRV